MARRNGKKNNGRGRARVRSLIGLLGTYLQLDNLTRGAMNVSPKKFIFGEGDIMHIMDDDTGRYE